MDLKFVKYEKKDHLALITFNRPEVMNAMHPPCHVEMDHVWDDFVADRNLWVAILTGAGERVFCAGDGRGGDIGSVRDGSGLHGLFRDQAGHGNTGADRAETLRRVVRRNGLRAALYVGDTEGDRLAAAAAGLAFLHAAWGFGRAPQAAVHLASFGDLRAWLDAEGAA